MTQPARRRLSPEDRRNQLLDCARQIIVDSGLSKLTMELIATQAGVSNPLIYKYFDTRLQLLQELLVREFRDFEKSMASNAGRVTNYREAVRGYVEVNFQQFAGGDVLSVLLGQPDIRHAVQHSERSRYAPFFIKEMAKEYEISRKLAEQILTLASGASVAAAEHFGKYGGNREEQIDETVDFIFGGLDRLLAVKGNGKRNSSSR